MAHILVYLQRTPGGLHPGSALALCCARDIGSERGATVTAICPGDAGSVDKGVATAASRFGADVLVFGGPKGLHTLFKQLNPVHVLVPWTDEGLTAAEDLPSGPPVVRWLGSRRPAWGGADSITAIVAGTLPWYALKETLEAEYQADVEACTQPPWVAALAEQGSAPMFGLGSTPLRWHASAAPSSDTLAALGRLGATPLDSVSEAMTGETTVLWLSTEPLPESLAQRPSSVRLVVLPGEQAGDPTELEPSWRTAEWVLGGAVVDVLETIVDSPWAPPRE